MNTKYFFCFAFLLLTIKISAQYSSQNEALIKISEKLTYSDMLSDRKYTEKMNLWISNDTLIVNVKKGKADIQEEYYYFMKIDKIKTIEQEPFTLEESSVMLLHIKAKDDDKSFVRLFGSWNETLDLLKDKDNLMHYNLRTYLLEELPEVSSAQTYDELQKVLQSLIK